MAYPTLPAFASHRYLLQEYARLMHEYGAKNIQPILDKTEKAMADAIKCLQKLPVDQTLAKKEPNAYQDILKLRPKGPRRIWPSLDKRKYCEKLEGAFLGRIAGCTLGAPVESWSIQKMEDLARELGLKFPITHYWPRVPDPFTIRYNVSKREDYSLAGMKGVPVDDDIVYTILGLLTVEENGPDFTVADNGRSWLKYLPLACTAEDIALKNLKKRVPIDKVGEVDNPYCEWIGADIRADPFGYMAPAWPERAADMAYRDAYLSHRRQGIYGEMFFAAAISAAFCAKDAIEAIHIGLTEIPAECALARAVRWALKTAPKIKNYKEARKAVDDKFNGMNSVHTINNACLTVFGITIGKGDFTRTIAETVAMGLDNDCTAATAGSIVGAVVGRKGIPAHWTKPFNNTVKSYFFGNPVYKIDDLVRRFIKQAERVYEL